MEQSFQDSFSTSLKAANDDAFLSHYDSNRKITAEGAIVLSDVHGNYNSLDTAYSIAQKNNLGVIINGDVVNDYHFKEFANALGYKTQNDLFVEYAAENLEQNDLETLFFAQQYQQVQSLEPFLEQFSQHQQESVRGRLEDLLKNSQSEDFREKFEQLAYGFKEEKEEEVIQNKLNLNSLYHVFMDEEAKRLAEEINKYEVDTIFNLGNHEHAFFVDQVRNYLEDPSKIIDATNHTGHIRVEQSNGQEMSVAGLTNCAQQMPYLEDVMLSQEEYGALMHHMSIDEKQYQTLLQGNVSQDKLSSIESLIREDREYQRIMRDENEDSLDVLLSHGQIGEVMMNNGVGYDVPYLGVAAYLSNKADLTIEGHIHSSYDGQNSFGNSMIRAAGEDGVIISKDETGKISKGRVRVDDTFDGNHHNPIPYSYEYMQRRVEQRNKSLEEMLQNSLDEEEQIAA